MWSRKTWQDASRTRQDGWFTWAVTTVFSTEYTVLRFWNTRGLRPCKPTARADTNWITSPISYLNLRNKKDIHNLLHGAILHLFLWSDLCNCNNFSHDQDWNKLQKNISSSLASRQTQLCRHTPLASVHSPKLGSEQLELCLSSVSLPVVRLSWPRKISTHLADPLTTGQNFN